MKTAALIAFAGIAAAASGEIIVAWDAFGQPGNQAELPTSVVADNVSATGITRGPGLGSNSGNNSLNSNNWDEAEQGAASEDYFTFSVTVDALYEVALDAFQIGSRSSNTGPGTLGLYFSGDSFSNPLATWTQSGDNFANNIFDLSGIVLSEGTTEFRIIEIGNTQADGSGATSGQGTFRIVDFFDNGNFIDTNLTGTVTLIPTPGAFGVFAAAGLVAARRRRA